MDEQTDLVDELADSEDEEGWVRWEVGARVMKLREERGWSRGELAAKLGVSAGRLGNWERGQNSPPLEKLMDLKRVLRVSLDELIAGRAVGEAAGEGLLRGEGREEALQHLAALESLLEKTN